MKGDLHCHTKVSDGSMSPEDVVDYAARIGLDYLAVTDHDSMAGVAAAQERAQIYGVKIIPGVEVSTFDYKNGKKVHLLCYMPRKTDQLESICTETLRIRQEASLKMIRKVESRYPIDLKTVKKYAQGSGAIYKQHIALALTDMGYSRTVYGDLFDSLFSSKKGWARVDCVYPETREALEVLKKTGGITVLAHPGVYHNFDIIEELCALGLDGIETYHPRQCPGDEKAALEAADLHGLLKTGGSDFHGLTSAQVNPLAMRVTSEQDLRKLLERIRIPAEG